jgi:hypothetical protein
MATTAETGAGNEPIIVKEGWLRKKGSRANLWSERYFVLRGPSLFYFIKSDNVVSVLNQSEDGFHVE